MDEQLQAEQYARTGNLMDLCHNEAWLRNAAQIEDECDGNVEAGAAMRGYVAWLKTLKSNQRQTLPPRNNYIRQED